ncbi:hypothetical protein B0H67DRAFT_479864 [Lasiosphaeris hirsuta]|uniref:Uncharacterized protein n=1 Tax=Lasiosphaeris hirsuta TaxID=260670 RepID=A0AA40B030_9PEZI|nr:hypothetical protein B0H67DRAFT_479864 [Lasiosphaeris hirsuta]
MGGVASGGADISLSFDQETHAWIQRLFEAWSCGAPASTFAAMRDYLLGQRERLDTRICTLSAVAKIVRLRRDADSRWEDLFALSRLVSHRKRKRAYNETNRLRNLALVAALWSPDLVFHYGWNSASQVHMNLLRACATRYPHFDRDFRPRLNAVLLQRHRHAIQHRRAKTLNEAPLQPHRDLDIAALVSAVPDEDLENQWVASQDGRVPVDDVAATLLRDLRPDHYPIYLLRRDCYGLLAARGGHVRSAPSALPSALSRDHVEVGGPGHSDYNPANLASLPFPVPIPDAEFLAVLEGLQLPGPPDAPRNSALVAEPVFAPPVPVFDLPDREEEAVLVAAQSRQGRPSAPLDALHDGYPDMIAAYVRKVLTEAEQQPSCPEDRRQLRAQWLGSPAEWILPGRRHQGASVHYVTSEEAVRAAQDGNIFRQPLVIKETFSDSGMHTVRAAADLLQGASINAVVSIDSLERDPLAPDRIDALLRSLCRVAVSPEETAAGANAVTFHLRNIIRSHRPRVIMLPRFRLLDSLVERLGHPRQSELASRTSFNTLSLAGAFSGPHLAAASGVWMRNLDGVKFCILASADALTPPELEAFARANRDGFSPLPPPRRKLEFLVLEQDDVLLIPPGLPVVYAVHSPTNGVMEGGSFWDSLNVGHIMQSARWACECQVTGDEEAITRQLPRLMEELGELMRQQPEQFQCA